MKTLEFWFDPVSPYAYLAFERLPEALAGFSYSVNYRPILFAALLKHWGHKGPAEIPPKRIYIFKDVLRSAGRSGRHRCRGSARASSRRCRRCEGCRS